MINSVISTGLQGLNTNLQGLNQSAHNVSTAFMHNEPLPEDEEMHEDDELHNLEQSPDIAREMVNMTLYQRGYEASIQVVQSATDMSGSMIDILA